MLRALGLGDTLTGVPALRALRRARPDHVLVLAGPPGPGALLQARGVVDRVLPVEGVGSLDEGALGAALHEHPDVLPPGRCVDLAVNLHGRGPQSVRALRRLLDERGAPGSRLLGHRCAAAGLDDGPAWEVDLHEVDRWRRLVAGVGGRSGAEDLVLPAVEGSCRAPGLVPAAPPEAVVLHPGAASGARRWPAGRWAAVAAALLGGGTDVVLTGGGAETALTADVAGRVRRQGTDAPEAGSGALVDLAGRCDLEQLAGVVGSARALVCGDTGVAHLATALRTPSVLLFGPVPPGAWGPAVDHDRHRVLWPAPSPSYRGDPHADGLDPVLARTSASDVLAALRSLPGPPTS
ncbi:glycosyltransferase family 9 protein [Pseudokineococcus basanitobsidens]|uniref:Glycosyltransferase family 9 protein n=1 Tax=Pseudokineococcus basanitobsidens TaxID=1926649 RepID=A0ABU8RHR9_9ACTN